MKPGLCMMIWSAALCAQRAPTFDAATVKRSESFDAQGAVRIGTTAAHGEVRMAGSTLRNCIRWSYGVRGNQVIGPAFLDTEHYDIVARGPADAGEDQLRLMLRALLEERFKMALH